MIVGDGARGYETRPAVAPPDSDSEAPEGAPRDAAALLALASRAPRVELSTHDLCFLATLYLRGQSAGHAAFAEEQLFELFEQAANVV